MRGKAPQGGVRRSGQGQDLPPLAIIGGAEHVPTLPRRGFPTPGEQHARIIGLDRHTARIGQRPFLLDAQYLPGVAEIVAHEHIARSADEHSFGPRRRELHVVDVRVIHAVCDASRCRHHPCCERRRRSPHQPRRYEDRPGPPPTRSRTVCRSSTPARYPRPASPIASRRPESARPPPGACRRTERRDPPDRWPATRSSADLPGRRGAPTWHRCHG